MDVLSCRRERGELYQNESFLTKRKTNQDNWTLAKTAGLITPPHARAQPGVLPQGLRAAACGNANARARAMRGKVREAAAEEREWRVAGFGDFIAFY